MQHYWSLDGLSLQKSWLTIGSFDGVHRGHQEIIRQLTAGAHAQGAPAVVLTFYPHPAVVLANRNEPYYLTTPEERAALLGELGVDVVVTHPFNREVAGTSAHDFMARLKSHLGLTHLWIGYDFALGRNREGNVDRLTELGQELGYTVQVLSAVKVNGELISSSEVRAALSEGDVQRASRLLGRPYSLSGQVIPGDGRGRTIGIPTANLDVWDKLLLPKSGVYACRAMVLGQTVEAVTNVGYRPTFENRPAVPRVETHLLDFQGDLYGRKVKLSFLARLRDEQRFPGVDALVAQIHEDIAQAKAIFQTGK